MAMLTIAGHAALADRAAERLAALIEDAIADHGSATVSLTGGTTPRDAYEALADPGRPWRDRVAWERVHLFWGDERHVPPDHPDSNFGMANQALVARVPIPPANVHRMRGEMPEAGDAARAYAEELRAGFVRAGRADLSFDVMLLGLGEDCHIASIFPGSELLTPSPGPGRGHPDAAVAVFAPHLDAWRITLTPAVILDSRAIVMLVSGGTKAAAVAAAIDGPLDVRRYPAQLLRAAGDRVEWLVDEDAARLVG